MRDVKTVRVLHQKPGKSSDFKFVIYLLIISTCVAVLLCDGNKGGTAHQNPSFVKKVKSQSKEVFGGYSGSE